MIFSLASPYFFTLSNATDLIEANSVTTILGGRRLRGPCLGRDRHIVCRSRLGHPICRGRYVDSVRLAGHCLRSAWRALWRVVLGSINALLTYYLRVVSIIVTIATSSIYYATLIYITAGTEIYNLPDWWTNRIVFFRMKTASGDIARLTLPMVIMAAVVIVTHLLMTRTHAGRQIYAFGGNPEAASRIGIKILPLQMRVYGYLGFLAGLAGFVQAHRVHQAVPTAMFGTELNVLAVAILGGASLVGGIGSMGGVVLGVLLLAILAERAESPRRVVFLRRGDWIDHPRLDQRHRLHRTTDATASSHRGVVMGQTPRATIHSRHGLHAALDRFVAGASRKRQ